MSSGPKILCLIPARSGSTAIPHKNIQTFRGKPLMAWSIEQALQSKHKMRVIVSTDDAHYAEIAKEYGAEVPFLRPKEISQELSIDYEFIVHALEYLERTEAYVPDFIVHLRPTYPTRTVKQVDDCIDVFIQNRHSYNSLRTVIPAQQTPFRMYRIVSDTLTPICETLDNRPEPFNICRQELPQCYFHNCCIDIYNTANMKMGITTGKRIYPYIMSADSVHDIDTPDDFKAAE
jgi:CMP-N,N'-diacetyllegionaminic acid synthase